ncbi:class I SAM-dependent methyltransferase [Caballeronia sp. LZ032]|uniref:class I SAM-dependent methyltransferase n=1 Tax=Caballeronia sp. LZ032 TaxID=3038565 RepID=UPI0028620D89|nr:class I SAM-dependent methyltransferase [Caballeronia sp. LZ032]MDR5883632.1 class I SAM-dependent methyltransferase [Caballeronia sp. LZ032]
MNTIDKVQSSFGQMTAEARLKDLEEENSLLIDQIHVVQVELERLHGGAPAQAQLQIVGSVTLDWVDDQLPEVMAEALRSQAMLETQKEIHRLEAEHALASKLGGILIQATNSSASMFAAPSKLLGVWRREKKTTPPGELGGKGFEKAIAAYRKGGLAAVEELLASVSVSAFIQANALTAVARSVMQKAPGEAAELARRAYAIEPRAFRLKWLAFRLHEAGKLLEAEAMLEALPSDMQFSESETRQAMRLRNDAQQARLREAKKKCAYSERRAELGRQVTGLTQAREEQAALAASRQKEIEALRQAEARLERDNFALTRERDEQAGLARRGRDEIKALQQAQARLEREHVELTRARDEQAALASQRQHEVETLRQAQARLQEECAGLTRARDEQLASAAQRQKESEALKQAIARIEQEQVELTRTRDQQAALAAQRQSEIETSQQVQIGLEQEHAGLIRARDEQAVLAGQRQGEIEALRQAHARLELKESALAERHETLQKEVMALARARDEQATLAAQRQGELLQLTRTQAALEKEKSTLEIRQRELELSTWAGQEHTKQIVQKVEALASTLAQRNGVVDDLFKKQSDSLIQVRKYLDGVLKNEIANSTKQTQAFIGLQNYYATGELPRLSCERNTWPVSQDFALYLVELIEANNYDLVIEFGSGISTVIVAKALTKASLRREGRRASRLVSFDHLDKYYAQTRAHLVQAGLEDAVQLMLAPLQDWQAPNGNTYPYYNCRSELSTLAQQHDEAGQRVLVIVDGPPAATGKHARYPAGPLLMQRFSAARVDLLLDDYIREDEKEVTKIWQAEMQAAGREHKLTELKFEKDACLVSVFPQKN